MMAAALGLNDHVRIHHKKTITNMAPCRRWQDSNYQAGPHLDLDWENLLAVATAAEPHDLRVLC